MIIFFSLFQFQICEENSKQFIASHSFANTTEIPRKNLWRRRQFAWPKFCVVINKWCLGLRCIHREQNGITFTERCPKGIVLCVVFGRRGSTWSAWTTHSIVGHTVFGGTFTWTWTDQSDIAGVAQRHENHSGKLNFWISFEKSAKSIELDGAMERNERDKNC